MVPVRAAAASADAPAGISHGRLRPPQLLTLSPPLPTARPLSQPRRCKMAAEEAGRRKLGGAKMSASFGFLRAFSTSLCGQLPVPGAGGAEGGRREEAPPAKLPAQQQGSPGTERHSRSIPEPAEPGETLPPSIPLPIRSSSFSNGLRRAARHKPPLKVQVGDCGKWVRREFSKPERKFTQCVHLYANFEATLAPWAGTETQVSLPAKRSKVLQKVSSK
nr:uncharacterized protein LOC113459260 [Zonotrichia albicollis]